MPCWIIDLLRNWFLLLNKKRMPGLVDFSDRMLQKSSNAQGARCLFVVTGGRVVTADNTLLADTLIFAI